METRAFGSTGLNVSSLGFGAGGIGSSAISESEADFLLNSILDAGIRLIDTARSYGLSEERIGRHLSHRRSDFVLSTKIGYGISGYQDWTSAIITAGVDHALRMLKTDRIDIVHFHSCSIEILKQEELLRSLERAVEAGKVLVPAYSGDNEPFDWALDSGRFRGVQTSVNVCDQRALNSLAIAQRNGIGVIAKRSLANAPWRNAPASAEDSAAIEYRRRWNAMNLRIDPGLAADVALRFVSYLPGVHCCLVGSSKLEHVLENVKIVERGPLPQETVAHIRSTFNTHGANWPGQI